MNKGPEENETETVKVTVVLPFIDTVKDGILYGQQIRFHGEKSIIIDENNRFIGYDEYSADS